MQIRTVAVEDLDVLEFQSKEALMEQLPSYLLITPGEVLVALLVRSDYGEGPIAFLDLNRNFIKICQEAGAKPFVFVSLPGPDAWPRGSWTEPEPSLRLELLVRAYSNKFNCT